MQGYNYAEKNQPPLSTRSIIPTTGVTTTRNGSPIQMNNAKGRTVHLLGNPHIATLPQLLHPNNLLPLTDQNQYSI